MDNNKVLVQVTLRRKLQRAALGQTQGFVKWLMGHTSAAVQPGKEYIA